jgi:hypothetical protein
MRCAILTKRRPEAPLRSVLVIGANITNSSLPG